MHVEMKLESKKFSEPTISLNHYESVARAMTHWLWLHPNLKLEHGDTITLTVIDPEQKERTNEPVPTRSR